MCQSTLLRQSETIILMDSVAGQVLMVLVKDRLQISDGGATTLDGILSGTGPDNHPTIRPLIAFEQLGL